VLQTTNATAIKQSTAKPRFEGSYTLRRCVNGGQHLRLQRLLRGVLLQCAVHSARLGIDPFQASCRSGASEKGASHTCHRRERALMLFTPQERACVVGGG